MVTQYDDKGKFFTQVIPKHPVSVNIQTVQNRVQGIVHIKSDARVKDELNGPERFIAVTDAVVYNSVNEEIYRCDFLVLNTHHIIWLVPNEENT